MVESIHTINLMTKSGDHYVLKLEYKRNCLQCEYWSMGSCGLFDGKLPGYISPMRLDECFKAENRYRLLALNGLVDGGLVVGED